MAADKDCSHKLFISAEHLAQHFMHIAVLTSLDVVLSAWPETPVGNVDLVRSLTYTLSLILAMTSKRAPATEKQVRIFYSTVIVKIMIR